MPLGCVCIESLGSSKLNATEGTVLDVALDLEHPRDVILVADHHCHTPTRHVVALRHRIELDTAVLGTRHLENAQTLLTQDERIRIVVHHHDVVILGKLHEPLVGLSLCTATCRHIRIVGPHQFHLREIHLLKLLEIRLPAVVLPQVVVHDLRPEDLRERGIGGVTGIGHQHLVAGIHEGEGDMEDTLLGADERQHLRIAVDVDTHQRPIVLPSGRLQVDHTPQDRCVLEVIEPPFVTMCCFVPGVPSPSPGLPAGSTLFQSTL